MLIETIDRYLTEVRRQLKLKTPSSDCTGRACWHDANLRADLRRLRILLTRQRNYRLGYDDRVAGNGIRSANGAYLDGYHSEGGLYYLTWSDLEKIKFRRERLY